MVCFLREYHQQVLKYIDLGWACCLTLGNKPFRQRNCPSPARFTLIVSPRRPGLDPPGVVSRPSFIKPFANEHTQTSEPRPPSALPGDSSFHGMGLSVSTLNFISARCSWLGPNMGYLYPPVLCVRAPLGEPLESPLPRLWRDRPA